MPFAWYLLSTASRPSAISGTSLGEFRCLLLGNEARATEKVFSLMTTVAAAVAEAPPKRFSGGGYWETMKGSMAGWFEIRVDGPGKKLHYRLFCVLDYWAIGIDGPLLVLVAGLVKPVDTVFTEKQYALIREMSKEYFGNNPRRK